MSGFMVRKEWKHDMFFYITLLLSLVILIAALIIMNRVPPVQILGFLFSCLAFWVYKRTGQRMIMMFAAAVLIYIQIVWLIYCLLYGHTGIVPNRAVVVLALLIYIPALAFLAIVVIKKMGYMLMSWFKLFIGKK